jgi:tellurite resistance protein TerB
MGRHQRRAFWEATIAVCALVAAPDGKVSFATRVRIDNILDSLPDLKLFDTNEFVELFDRFVEEIRVSPRKARSRVLEVARKGANGADEAELLAKIAFAVADPEAATDSAESEPIETLCRELGVDPKAVLAELATIRAGEVRAEPVAGSAKSPPHLKSVDDIAEDEPEMQDEQKSGQSAGISVVASPSNDVTDAPKPANAPDTQVSPPPAAREPSGTTDLSQQLLVDGTKAVIALCGRTKTGALEALRIYENEQLAAADCALSEKIANEKFWLSPVTLFPADTELSDTDDDNEPTSIHVMCLSRPDGSVEALRAFENADQASADLEFFRNISNDKMWMSVVQFKTVT